METSNDLPPTSRRSAIELLNEHLADAIDLHLQAKQAHWNIKGPNFVGLHELFDRVAAQAAEYWTRSPSARSRSVELRGEHYRRCQRSHSSANIPSRSVTGALTFERCRMRWRHSAAAHVKRSMMQQR